MKILVYTILSYILNLEIILIYFWCNFAIFDVVKNKIQMFLIKNKMNKQLFDLLSHSYFTNWVILDENLS